MAKNISKNLIAVQPFEPDSWPPALFPPAKKLLKYWSSKCKDGKYPHRSDIAPGEITRILPYVFIVERADQGKSDYRFLLVGTEIVKTEGECTGQLLSELFPDRERYADIWKQYDESCSGVIYVRHQNLGWKGKKYIEYETVLLPLRGNSENVEYLIGTAYAALLPD